MPAHGATNRCGSGPRRSAAGSGAQDVTFLWWFPRLTTESFFSDPPAGIPSDYLPFVGPTIGRTFAVAGAVPVFLEVRSPDGTRQITRYDVNVIDGRRLDSLTINPPVDLRVGQTKLLDAVAASGTVVQMQPIEPPGRSLSPCGVTNAFPVRTLETLGLEAGTCTMRVYTEGNDEYQPTQSVVTFPVLRGEQSITAGEPSDLAVGDQQTLPATASSNLPVVADVVMESADVCTATDLTVTATGPGTCRLFLTQSGDADHLPAPPVERQFDVSSPITVTARDETMVHGGTPAYGFDVSDPTVEVTGVECTAEPPLTVGTHPITCSGGSAAGGLSLKHAPGVLTVTAAPAVVTVNPPSVQYSDPLPDLAARWTVAGLLDNDTLSGELTGCTTDGLSVVDGLIRSPSGSYDLVNCTGLTDSNYEVTFGGSLRVHPEDATVTYAGDRYVSTAARTTTAITVAATVTQDDDGSAGDLTAATVDILLFAAGNTGRSPDLTSTGVAVDTHGQASAMLSDVPAGTYRVVVRLSPGNGFFAGPQTEDRLVVYRPTRGASVKGSGWVRDAGSRDGRGHLKLSMRYTNDLVPQGRATYQWRSTETGFDYVVASTSWSTGTLALDGSSAVLSVPAALTVTKPRTGAVVADLSGSGYELRMVVVDGGKGRRADRLSVTVLDRSGATVHSVDDAMMGSGDLAVRASRWPWSKKAHHR